MRQNIRGADAQNDPSGINAREDMDPTHRNIGSKPVTCLGHQNRRVCKLNGLMTPEY